MYNMILASAKITLDGEDSSEAVLRRLAGSEARRDTNTRPYTTSRSEQNTRMYRNAYMYTVVLSDILREYCCFIALTVGFSVVWHFNFAQS